MKWRDLMSEKLEKLRADLAAQVAEEENTGLLGNTSVAFFDGR